MENQGLLMRLFLLRPRRVIVFYIFRGLEWYRKRPVRIKIRVEG
jgi:hypothetical protein